MYMMKFRYKVFKVIYPHYFYCESGQDHEGHSGRKCLTMEDSL